MYITDFRRSLLH